MKIFIITTNPHYQNGGSEFLWQSTAQELIRMGFQVDIAASKFDTNPDWYRNCHSVYLYPRGDRSLPSKIQRYLFSSYGQTATRALRGNYDLILISQGSVYEGIELIDRFAKEDLPFVTISHSVRDKDWPFDSVVERVWRSFSKARQNYFVSKRNLELFEQQIGGALRPTAIFPPMYQVPHQLQIAWPKPTPLRLAVVARINPSDKGHDLILEAFRDGRWRSRDLEIHCYGEGFWEKTLVSSIQKYGLESQMFFHGYVSDIQKIWEENHGLLLPSRSEGCAMTMVEAMLASRFVITTEVSDNAALIQEGRNGFVIPFPTIREVNQGLERAWQVRDRWQAMGEMARSDIEKRVPKHPGLYFAQELQRYLLQGQQPSMELGQLISNPLIGSARSLQ